MFLLFLLVLAVGAAAFLTVRLYNRLRVLSEGVKRAQSNLVGELRKRASLVNQLIDVCKGYGDHEKLTHLTVSAAVQADADPANIARASNNVLAGVNVIADRFPELKANETYRTLMLQLETIENALQVKREALNATVEGYNRVRAAFPAVLIAAQIGFPEAPYFSTDEAGLDTDAMFKTDDGEILRAQFARVGKGVGEATRQIAAKAGDALKAGQAQLNAPAEAGEAISPETARAAPPPPEN
jgi:LemA protein